MRTSVKYQRARMFTDLHFRQKWCAAWPRLAGLPREGIRLLDAGCGEGRWSAEIAARRPGWIVAGVDRDETAIQRAFARRAALGLSNLSFEQREFTYFAPARPFDVVLSICSAHYGPSVDDTERLFQHMHDWLKPSGRVVLLVPRCVAETPFVTRLAHPGWHELFSREALVQMCDAGGLSLELIAPCIGRLGTVAKQLDWMRSEVPALARGALVLLAHGIAMIDAGVSPRSDRSLLWLVVARRARRQT
jgi:SAM-dependent methyltransferase